MHGGIGIPLIHQLINSGIVNETSFDPTSYDYSILIGGQSNGVGLATAPSGWAPTTPISHAMIQQVGFGAVYGILEFGVNNQGFSSTQFGVELTLGEYMANVLGYDFYMAKFAVAGKGIAVIPTDDDFNVTTNELFPQLSARHVQANGNLPAFSKPLKRILIWIQGERDGQGETGQPTIYSSVWDTNFLAIVAQLEANVGHTFDQVIIGKLSEQQRLAYKTTETGFDQVIAKQQSVVDGNPSKYTLINTDNFYAIASDRAHFNRQGMRDYGNTLAKVILRETLPAIDHSPSYNPTQYANCMLWLDSKQGITLNGSNVSAWADQSGNGNNATQSNASFQPAYDNVNKQIVFAAASFLDMTSHIANFLGASEGEWIMVYERTNTAATNWVFSLGNTTSDNFFYAYGILLSTHPAGPNKSVSYKQNGAIAGSGTILYGENNVPTSQQIIAMISHNTWGWQGRQSTYKEHTLTVAGGSGPITGTFLNDFSTTPNKMIIGGLGRTSNTLSTFKLKSLIFYPRYLKFEERKDLYTFLTTYYA